MPCHLPRLHSSHTTKQQWSIEANDNTAIHQTNLRDGITFTPKNGKIQGKRPIKACWIPFISTLGLTTQPGVPCTHRPRLEDQTMVYPSRPKINMEHGRITRQQMATNRAYTVANSSKPTGPIVPSQYACSHKSHSTFTKNRKLVWEHVRYSNVFCTGEERYGMLQRFLRQPFQGWIFEALALSFKGFSTWLQITSWVQFDLNQLFLANLQMF